MKEVSEVSAVCLTNIWNTQIIDLHIIHIFRDDLKLEPVTHVFKKEDSNLAKHYRPVSLLAIASKIFERQLQKQTI